MLQRIRSSISKLPSIDFTRVVLKGSRRMSFFEGCRIQPMAVNQIMVQSALPDTEGYDEGDGEHDNGPEVGQEQHPSQEHSQMYSEELAPPNRQRLHAQVVLDILGNKLPEMNVRHEGESEESNHPEEYDVDEQNDAQPTCQIEDNEGQKDELPFFPVYLQTQFEIMYYLGLSPIRGNGMPGSKTQLVAFGLITVIALCHFIAQMKQFTVAGAEAGNLSHYITIWYCMSSLLLQLYLLKLFVFDRNCMLHILQSPDKTHKQRVFQKSKEKFMMGPIVAALIQIVASAVLAIRVDWLHEGDTFEDILLSRSMDVSRYLFVWTKDENKTAAVDEQFGETLTPTTLLMGTTGLLMNFVGNLKQHLTQDVFLISALHTYQLSQGFKKTVTKLLREEEPSNQNIQNLLGLHEDVSEMVTHVDNGFGHLFKLLHVENGLACSYFLAELLQGTFSDIRTLVGFIYIPNILLAYAIAAQSVALTNATRNMIEKQYNKSQSNEVDRSRFLCFLKTFEEHPIGIGHGQFLLDETFASKFVGVVISCFMIVADADKDAGAAVCNCKLK